jgi:hypothetical protein
MLAIGREKNGDPDTYLHLCDPPEKWKKTSQSVTQQEHVTTSGVAVLEMLRMYAFKSIHTYARLDTKTVNQLRTTQLQEIIRGYASTGTTMWFAELFGVNETQLPDQCAADSGKAMEIYKNNKKMFEVTMSRGPTTLTVVATRKVFSPGEATIIRLRDLRGYGRSAKNTGGESTYAHIAGEAMELHASVDPTNCVFQVCCAGYARLQMAPSHPLCRLHPSLIFWNFRPTRTQWRAESQTTNMIVLKDLRVL